MINHSKKFSESCAKISKQTRNTNSKNKEFKSKQESKKDQDDTN